MPQQIIFTDDFENEIVKRYSQKWRLSKMETIKKFIREFENKGVD